MKTKEYWQVRYKRRMISPQGVDFKKEVLGGTIPFATPELAEEARLHMLTCRGVYEAWVVSITLRDE